MNFEKTLTLAHPKKLEKEFLFVRNEIKIQLEFVFGYFNGTKTAEQIAYQNQADALENLLVTVNTARVNFLEELYEPCIENLLLIQDSLKPFLSKRKTKLLRNIIDSISQVEEDFNHGSSE